MSLVTANDVRRGHKAGHYLLVLHDRQYFLYHTYITGHDEHITYLRRMTPDEFADISYALWEFGKKRIRQEA